MNEPQLSVALRDIQGLDTVGWWPPAPGWWLLTLFGLLLIALLLLLIKRWIKGEPTVRLKWQRDAARQLHQLRKRIVRDDSKTLSAELSELMRRIAIARCGREQCAGLAGEEWLDWLSNQDPKGFDWNRHSQLLLAAPYAPPHTQADDSSALRELIRAALAWTRPSSRECLISNETQHA